MSSSLAIACACITGICLGITLHYKSSLENSLSLVENGQTSGQVSGTTINSLVTQNLANHSSTQNTLVSSNIDSKINQLLDLQSSLKVQQSEFNRELNAIQFRLDTHSASFRPLRSERASQQLTSPQPAAASSLSPLLPPRQ